MVRIQGWIKNFETKNKVVWTQNKSNPLKLSAEKDKNKWTLWAFHASQSPKILKRSLSKDIIKSFATKIMKQNKVSPMNQRVRK